MPRHAPIMTLADFKSTIVSHAIANDFEEDYGPMDHANPSYDSIFYNYGETMPKVESDWSKIDFSAENLQDVEFHITDDGVPFALMIVGGDWETPLAAVVYFDGKRFRGYIPKDGNTYNHSIKTAYGNDDKSDKKELLKRYGKVDEEFLYDLDPDTKKVLADINKRIVARGYCTAVDYGDSPASKLATHRKTIEPDLTKMAIIPKDLIYFEVHLAAGASYFRFNLRAGGAY